MLVKHKQVLEILWEDGSTISGRTVAVNTGTLIKGCHQNISFRAEKADDVLTDYAKEHSANETTTKC